MGKQIGEFPGSSSTLLTLLRSIVRRNRLHSLHTSHRSAQYGEWSYVVITGSLITAQINLRIRITCSISQFLDTTKADSITFLLPGQNRLLLSPAAPSICPLFFPPLPGMSRPVYIFFACQSAAASSSSSNFISHMFFYCSRNASSAQPRKRRKKK